MITNRQFMILQYYVVRPLFLGFGISSICGISDTATPFSALIGFILGFIFCLFLYKIIELKGDKTIVEYLDSSKSSFFTRLFMIFTSMLLFLNIITIVSVLSKSFYLTNTPVIFNSLAIYLVIFYALKKGVVPFVRASELLFPLCLAIFIFQTLSYGFSYNLDNLKPYLNASFIDIIKSSLMYFVYTAAPCLVLLNFKNKNFDSKKAIKGYLIGSGTILITLFLITVVIGFPLAGVFRYPEYMIMKKINILNFIANIENILMIAFIIDNIILGFLLINFISDLVKSFTKNKFVNKWWNLFFMGVICTFFVFFIYPNYSIVLFLYNDSYIIILILLILSMISLYLSIKKRLRNNS